MAFRLGISILVLGIIFIFITCVFIDEDIEVCSGGAVCWMTFMMALYLPLLLAYQKDMNIINSDLDAI